MLLRGAVAPHLEEAALEVGAHGMVLSSCIFRGFSRRVTVAWSDLTNLEVKKSVMVNGGVDQRIYGVLEICQGVCVCVCAWVYVCVCVRVLIHAPLQWPLCVYLSLFIMVLSFYI